MSQSIPGPSLLPVQIQARELARSCGLPFQEVLSPEFIADALDAEQFWFRECVFTPAVTLQTFLWQVLSADHSCRDAVAQLMATRIQQGLTPPSPDTDPYCKARQRIPEELCARLARVVGAELHASDRQHGRLAGRPVKLVDGTTVSMPDTPENQNAYPQAKTQAAGVGFPIMRICALLCLASGAVLDLAMGRYAGKETGETALFRQMWKSLFPGDIVVGDRFFASFWDLVLLKQRGVDGVYRQHHLRPIDFRRGRRLGPDDHLLRWSKPPRPDWMDEETYRQIPAELTVREMRVRVTQRGWRVRELVIVTTLLDDSVVSRDELSRVYLERWQAEVDLRAIKITMQMDVLRCKSPAMVRKEVWMHLLAYNLIRTVIARAADLHGLEPRSISFKGALQTLNAFRAACEITRGTTRERVLQILYAAIATHIVGNRPDRFEPRAIKRRPKPHKLLTVPRAVARKRLAD
jgi:Transposase DDE domain